MDVLTFFKRIHAEQQEALQIRDTIQSLYDSLSPSGIRYDADKVQTSPSDRMVEVFAELSEVEDRYKHKMQQLTSHVLEAEQIIEQVSTPECRELLRMRYIRPYERRGFMPWQDIANHMGYSRDYVRGKLHGKAIQQARTIWQKRTFENT